MATSLVRSSTSRLTSFLRLNLNPNRKFSSSTESSSTSASEPSKRKKKRKKNLFEVVQFLPNWGIGYHLAKSHWTNVSYEITKINLYKDGRHGKAWGVAFKDGLPAEAPKKISGVHKRCWRYIPSLSKLINKVDSLSSQPSKITQNAEV